MTSLFELFHLSQTARDKSAGLEGDVTGPEIGSVIALVPPAHPNLTFISILKIDQSAELWAQNILSKGQEVVSLGRQPHCYDIMDFLPDVSLLSMSRVCQLKSFPPAYNFLSVTPQIPMQNM